MKVTILFGSESDMARIDHNKLIKDWSIDQMFFADELDVSSVSKFVGLVIRGTHAVIRTTDRAINFATLALINENFPNVAIVDAQSIQRPQPLPAMPFFPRDLNKSILSVQMMAASSQARQLAFDKVWVDDVPDYMTADAIINKFTPKSGIQKFQAEDGMFSLDGVSIPWDHSDKINSLSDEIRQKQIQAVVRFECRYPGVPWEIVTEYKDELGPSFALNNFVFTVKAKYPTINVKP